MNIKELFFFKFLVTKMLCIIIFNIISILFTFKTDFITMINIFFCMLVFRNQLLKICLQI